VVIAENIFSSSLRLLAQIASKFLAFREFDRTRTFSRNSVDPRSDTSRETGGQHESLIGSKQSH
jgi:hypothetical protein